MCGARPRSGDTWALLSSPPGSRSPTGALGPNPRRSTTLDEQRSIPPEHRPPGLRAQIGATREAALGLAKAHIDLAKAEASAIGAEIAKVAGFFCLAIAAVLLAVMLAVIGTSLFLAEWLLGSMGWGVLHGVLLLVAIAVMSAFVPLGMGRVRIGVAFLLGVAAAVLVSIVLVLALPNQLYASIGASTLPGIEPGVRPLVVGAAIWAVVGLIAGLVMALRFDGWTARIGSLLGGAVVGALIGAVTAVDTGTQVGIGIGIAVGYITWIGIMAADMARTGVDAEALKARFTPTKTIETSKETLAWLQSKMPPGTGS